MSGLRPTVLTDGKSGQEWNALPFYAVAAVPFPFTRWEWHRLFVSLYGGKATDVDRFSAFHLGGVPGGLR